MSPTTALSQETKLKIDAIVKSFRESIERACREGVDDGQVKAVAAIRAGDVVLKASRVEPVWVIPRV